MAVLDLGNRSKVLAHLCRAVVGGWPALTKPDVQAAINATDDWIDTNQSAYNSALPLPFRTTATLTQKTILFAYVALRRAGLLKTEGE